MNLNEGEYNPDKILEQCESCVDAYVSQYRHKLSAYVNEAGEEFIELDEGLGVEVESVARRDELASRFQQMSTTDYRRLLGTLAVSRSFYNDSELNKEIANVLEREISDNLSRILTLMNDEFSHYTQMIYQGDIKKEDLAHEECQWAYDSSLDLRSLYRFGVNILNPTWNPSIPSSLTAVSDIAIHPYTPSDNQGGQIYINNQSLDTVIISDSDEYRLTEGDSVIGLSYRKYRDGKFHDENVPPYLSTVHVPFIAEKSEENQTGGALMILRHDGRIYLFDRGLIGSLRIFQRRKRFTYTPETTKDANDFWSYGITKLETSKTDIAL